METWEALDVDDSDLPSLLRPCNRLLPPDSPALAPHHQHSLPQSSHHHHHRLIPGPAGLVQTAMRHKTQDRDSSNSVVAHLIPTQEYIRKAVEDNASDFDHDFQSDPWISALEFLGVVDGMVPSTPLSSIKQCLDVGKVDRVVAVIKSCTPNGLGGLMVSLKDPTGTVGASIHHRVLSESEFGKDLLLGSVLILQKVAVFAPSHSAYYLNITVRNLTKVFPKHSGPPLKQICPAYRYVASDTDYSGKASRMNDMFTSELGTRDSNMISHTNMRRIADYTSQAEKENLVPGSLVCQNQVSAVERDPFTLGQEAGKATCADMVVEKNANCNVGYTGYAYDQVSEGNPQDCLRGSSVAKNSATQSIDEETRGATTVQNQTQPLIARTNLPQWTDEQLQELFASDGEDDGFMY